MRESDGIEGQKEKVDDFKVSMNKIVILMKDLKIPDTQKLDFWFYYEWI